MASARNGLALLFVLPDRSMCGLPEVGPQMYVLTRSFCRAQPKGRKFSTHRDARYIHTPGALGPAPRMAQAVNNRLSTPPARGLRTSYTRSLHHAHTFRNLSHHPWKQHGGGLPNAALIGHAAVRPRRSCPVDSAPPAGS